MEYHGGNAADVTNLFFEEQVHEVRQVVLASSGSPPHPRVPSTLFPGTPIQCLPTLAPCQPSLLGSPNSLLPNLSRSLLPASRPQLPGQANVAGAIQAPVQFMGSSEMVASGPPPSWWPAPLTNGSATCLLPPMPMPLRSAFPNAHISVSSSYAHGTSISTNETSAATQMVPNNVTVPRGLQTSLCVASACATFQSAQADEVMEGADTFEPQLTQSGFIAAGSGKKLNFSEEAYSRAMATAMQVDGLAQQWLSELEGQPYEEDEAGPLSHAAPPGDEGNCEHPPPAGFQQECGFVQAGSGVRVKVSKAAYSRALQTAQQAALGAEEWLSQVPAGAMEEDGMPSNAEHAQASEPPKKAESKGPLSHAAPPGDKGNCEHPPPAGFQQDCGFVQAGSGVRVKVSKAAYSRALQTAQQAALGAEEWLSQVPAGAMEEDGMPSNAEHAQASEPPKKAESKGSSKKRSTSKRIVQALKVRMPHVDQAKPSSSQIKSQHDATPPVTTPNLPDMATCVFVAAGSQRVLQVSQAAYAQALATAAQVSEHTEQWLSQIAAKDRAPDAVPGSQLLSDEARDRSSDQLVTKGDARQGEQQETSKCMEVDLDAAPEQMSQTEGTLEACEDNGSNLKSGFITAGSKRALQVSSAAYARALTVADEEDGRAREWLSQVESSQKMPNTSGLPPTAADDSVFFTEDEDEQKDDSCRRSNRMDCRAEVQNTGTGDEHPPTTATTDNSPAECSDDVEEVPLTHTCSVYDVVTESQTVCEQEVSSDAECHSPESPQVSQTPSLTTGGKPAARKLGRGMLSSKRGSVTPAKQSQQPEGTSSRRIQRPFAAPRSVSEGMENSLQTADPSSTREGPSPPSQKTTHLSSKASTTPAKSLGAVRLQLNKGTKRNRIDVSVQPQDGSVQPVSQTPDESVPAERPSKAKRLGIRIGALNLSNRRLTI